MSSRLGAALVILAVLGLGGVATGPAWVVDTVTCHAKFHAERTKKVTAPLATDVKHGAACP